jgi:hypothetical protein
LLGFGVLAAALMLVWMRRDRLTVLPTPRVDEISSPDREAPHGSGGVAPPTPRVDEISPIGVRRGYASELTIRGSALSGNPRLVASFRFIAATPAPNGSNATAFTTRLTVARDTPLGIYPVRVLTDDGLSDPFALAVGQLPQVREKEDNDDIDKPAQRIALPAVIEGMLPERDYDNFRFRGKKGQQIVAQIECAGLGSDFEPSPIELVSLDRKFQSGLPAVLPKDDDYLFDVRRAPYRPIKTGRPVYRTTIGELPMAAEVHPGCDSGPEAPCPGRGRGARVSPRWCAQGSRLPRQRTGLRQRLHDPGTQRGARARIV